MDMSQLVISLVVLGVLAYFGLLRPTGMARRSRAEAEQDAQNEAVAKWLKKDSE